MRRRDIGPRRRHSVTDRWKQADELSAHVKELNFAFKEREAQGEFIPFRKVLVGYLIGLVGTIGSAILADRLFGINPYAAGLTLCGVTYLSAAAQRPRI